MKRASRGLREVECLGHRGGFGRSSLIWACQARRDDINEGVDSRCPGGGDDTQVGPAQILDHTLSEPALSAAP
jgi:hypothetical protein